MHEQRQRREVGRLEADGPELEPPLRAMRDDARDLDRHEQPERRDERGPRPSRERPVVRERQRPGDEQARAYANDVPQQEGVVVAAARLGEERDRAVHRHDAHGRERDHGREDRAVGRRAGGESGHGERGAASGEQRAGEMQEVEQGGARRAERALSAGSTGRGRGA